MVLGAPEEHGLFEMYWRQALPLPCYGCGFQFGVVPVTRIGAKSRNRECIMKQSRW